MNDQARAAGLRGGWLRTVGDPGTHRGVAAQPLGTPWNWTLAVSGAVREPVTLSLSDLWNGPVTEFSCDVNCVSSGRIARTAEGRPRPIQQFAGIAFDVLCEQAGVAAEVRSVRFVSRAPGACGPAARRHETSIAWEDLQPRRAWLAGMGDRRPLPYRNGGPLRLVVEGLYFYKSIKWLSEIQFSTTDIRSMPGTWEEYAGYHRRARIAQRERFEPFFRLQGHPDMVAPEQARPLLLECLAAGQLAGLTVAHLTSPDAAAWRLGDLPELLEQAGQLRLARRDGARYEAAAFRGLRFSRRDYQGRDFSRVNFSLSRFLACRLAGARFCHGDMEGATFADGCDLQGADFSDAYLANTAFYACDLRGASLRRAELAGASFVAAQGGKASLVEGLDLTAAKGLDPEVVEWLRARGAVGTPADAAVPRLASASVDAADADAADADAADADAADADAADAADAGASGRPGNGVFPPDPAAYLPCREVALPCAPDQVEEVLRQLTDWQRQLQPGQWLPARIRHVPGRWRVETAVPCFAGEQFAAAFAELRPEWPGGIVWLPSANAPRGA